MGEVRNDAGATNGDVVKGVVVERDIHIV